MYKKQSLRSNSLWFACLTIGLIFFSGMSSADITEVSNSELKLLREEGVALIDIRRPDEWAYSGVIEGSHLLTFFDASGRYDVTAWVTALKKIVPDGKPFILICEVGGRSGSVSRLLDGRLGVESVHNLSRGIRDWLSKGEAVVPYKPKAQ